jgi:hypothetical protein
MLDFTALRRISASRNHCVLFITRPAQPAGKTCFWNGMRKPTA